MLLKRTDKKTGEKYYVSAQTGARVDLVRGKYKRESNRTHENNTAPKMTMKMRPKTKVEKLYEQRSVFVGNFKRGLKLLEKREKINEAKFIRDCKRVGVNGYSILHFFASN